MFTEAGGRVAVECEVVEGSGPRGRGRAAGAWVRVAVEDTGIGIPADQLDAVFDPFVQAETGTTRTHGGTGLGLTISRRLARLMDGELTLESELGKGTRATLWLPAAGGSSGGNSG
jgi:signal transduction histidine kinase